MTGLDEDVLRGMLTGNRRKRTMVGEAIRYHVSRHRGYIAWSGGKDSTVVAHAAARACPGVPLIWFHSGLEFPETERYVTSLAHDWGANLHIVHAVPSALDVMEKSGLWEHGVSGSNTGNMDLHTTLISRPSQAAHEAYGRGEVLGLRAGESAGRRALLASTGGIYARKDGTQVCAPLWSWSNTDVHAYYAAVELPLNPIYAKLAALGAPPSSQRVGLILDGNGLSSGGRGTWLRLGWPDVWAELCDRLPRLTEWR